MCRQDELLSSLLAIFEEKFGPCREWTPELTLDIGDIVDTFAISDDTPAIIEVSFRTVAM